MCPEPESFSEKVWLSAIDKLFIGVAAALIILLAEDQFKSAEMLQEAKVAKSQARSIFVANAQEKTSDALSDYIELAVLTSRQEGVILEDSVVQLYTLRERVSLQASLAGIVSKRLGTEGEVLSNKMSAINSAAARGRSSEIAEGVRDLRISYAAYLKVFQEELTAAIEQDFEVANE